MHDKLPTSQGSTCFPACVSAPSGGALMRVQPGVPRHFPKSYVQARTYTDDVLYDDRDEELPATQTPKSVRRYPQPQPSRQTTAAPQTHIKVTHHANPIPPRSTRTQE